jgi:peptidoglycan hydrolase-like protein with peptidoglycan-binding domain
VPQAAATLVRRSLSRSVWREFQAAAVCAVRSRRKVSTKKVVVSSTLLLAGLLSSALLAACGTATVQAADPASSSPSPRPQPSASAVAPLALRVVAVWPHAQATNVSFGTRIKIRFSAPLAAGSPMPQLTPLVAGTWVAPDPTTLVFYPSGHLPLLTTVQLTIPAGPDGVRSVSGGVLATAYSFSFATAGPSVLRLQQLLAELRYLPLTFTAAAPTSSSQPSAAASASAAPTLGTGASGPAATADAVSLLPVQGTFRWRYPHIPSALAALWQPGVQTTLVKGAIMAFESDHGLADDGIAGPQVWNALLTAVADHQVNQHAYNYIEVSTANPETLRVWQNGMIVYSTLANTGIAARPTELGTFCVYARYLTTTMSGTNADGTHYHDPGIPDVAYFNGGDAVHGFFRSQYGFPQSLGCVELPYAAAAIVFRYDPIGTLVTVF